MIEGGSEEGREGGREGGRKEGGKEKGGREGGREESDTAPSGTFKQSLYTLWLVLLG